jgi:hypothetical protein
MVLLEGFIKYHFLYRSIKLSVQSSLSKIEAHASSLQQQDQRLDPLVLSVVGVGSFLVPKVTVETLTISREFLIRRS